MAQDSQDPAPEPTPEGARPYGQDPSAQECEQQHLPVSGLPEADLTQLLQRMRDGDSDAFAEAFEKVYGYLRNLSRRYVSPGPDPTLGGTALVHEVYLRLERYLPQEVSDSKHFQRLASRTMRHVLVDYQRRKLSDKRSAPGKRLALEEVARDLAERARDPVQLDEALSRLEEFDPQAAQIVELRFFGGMSLVQIAENLGVTVKRVELDWRVARAWLQTELGGPDQ